MEKLFGDYRVEKPLGKGGMADVFEVEHVRLGSRHALKLFTCESDDPDIRDRFLREGHLLAKLAHPRIVRVTDFGADDETGRPYFVMDLVLSPDGDPKTLADAKRDGVDESQVAEWYEDVREGLAYVHAQGIVHRDLKLENVLVGPDGHAVISDFGISRIVDPSVRTRMSVDFATTIVALKAGRVPLMGTRGYMAPELETGGSASPASDYYALGVMVLYLLAGAWYDRNVTDLRSELAGFDPAWAEVLPKLLHANPVARECPSFRAAAEARRDAAELAAESALDAAEASAKKMRRWAVSAMLVAVAAVGITGGAWWSSSSSRRAYARAFPIPADSSEFDEGYRADDMRVAFDRICRESYLESYFESTNLAEKIDAVADGSKGDAADFLLKEGAILASVRFGDMEGAKDRFDEFVNDYEWLPASFTSALSNQLVRAGVVFSAENEKEEETK